MFTKDTSDNSTLKRAEIRRIFRRHRGAQAEIARELGLAPVTICLWLRGKVQSGRISDAMTRRAADLLASEAERAA